jgi:hypothetical protein
LSERDSNTHGIARVVSGLSFSALNITKKILGFKKILLDRRKLFMNQKKYDRRAGMRMHEQYTRLYMTQKQFASLLGTYCSRVTSWKKKEPNYSSVQRRKMIKLGINPIYPDGFGDIVLPGFTFDQVCKNIQDELEAINGNT